MKAQVLLLLAQEPVLAAGGEEGKREWEAESASVQVALSLCPAARAPGLVQVCRRLLQAQVPVAKAEAERGTEAERGAEAERAAEVVSAPVVQ